MNPRLLRPVASSVHPEAAAWRSAVIANSGGTPSATTVRAVSKFCADIDAAGIRSLMYRVNLFCGPSLNACLVPLYRSAAFGGSTYGNTTDTNNGPFVSGDYTETGADGGLLGNGSSKWLNTGLQPDATPTFLTFHLSFWTRGGSVSGTTRVMGCETGTPSTHRYLMDRRPAANGNDLITIGGATAAGIANPPSDDATAGHFLGTRTSATSLIGYKNAVVGQTTASSITPVAPAFPVGIFAGNLSGTPGNFYGRRLAAYSIGDGLTGAQVTSFYNALNTFMASLSRT
jgi:hypothetical protein